MIIEKELYYTNDHEWLKVEEGEATIGLSDHAQESLGDVVYVELPEVGEEIEMGEEFGAVESVKAAADVFMPVSGEILEINEELLDNPQLINETPYEAWMVRIKLSDAAQIDELMTATAYENYLEEA
ncbi:MAG: glycine cleavage system protein GcvH [Tissierellia bacterium]|nr:glycine cleavage system protein GcvH [Tissierellia bacterium]